MTFLELTLTMMLAAYLFHVHLHGSGDHVPKRSLDSGHPRGLLPGLLVDRSAAPTNGEGGTRGVTGERLLLRRSRPPEQAMQQ